MSKRISVKANGPWLFDLTLTVVLLVLGLVTLFAYPPDDVIEYRDPDVLGVVLIATTIMPIAFRRVAPLAVALVLAAAGFPFLVWEYPAPVSAAVALVAVYSLGAYAPFIRGVIGVAAMGAATFAFVFVTGRRYPEAEDLGSTDMLFVALAFIGAWAIGRAVRGPRMQAQLLEERADHLERTHEAEVRAAIAEERGQIARELHDVVAHHVSVMTVQAAGASRSLDRDPQRSKDALQSIESTGRTALTEMRRIVGVLRGPDGTPSDVTTSGRTPQPGLADLPRLVDDLTETGLTVTVDVEGEHDDLPLGVDLTAFRIIQEALTNTLKHAEGGADAHVVLRYSPSDLVVEVTDNGSAKLPRLDRRRPGHGLLGMRERVAVYGGTLRVGAQPAGGFAVRASIPLS